MGREARRTEAGRHDDAGLVEPSGDLFAAPTREARRDDARPRVDVAWGENRCSQIVQAVAETRRESQIVGENVIYPEVEDVLHGGAKCDPSAVAHGREL